MHGNIRDLTGQKFGRLTVLEITNNKDGHNYKWLCQCDCGNIKEIAESSLTGGSTVSCGCYSREVQSKRLSGKPAQNLKPKGVANKNAVYKTYRESAKARGYVFNLTLE